MALIGTVLCVVVMFLMDWVTALVTFGIVAILYLYISYRKPGLLQHFRMLSTPFIRTGKIKLKLIYFDAMQQIIQFIFSEANWGSSTQAQQFVLALKNVQSLNDVPDHVKNYRPKLLVFTGLPIHRQPLVDFGYLITKKLSLMICSHIEPVNVHYSKRTKIFIRIYFITKNFMVNIM